MTMKLCYIRQGTAREKTVELCLQDGEEGPLMVFELDIARAYTLKVQLEKFVAPYVEELLR